MRFLQVIERCVQPDTHVSGAGCTGGSEGAAQAEQRAMRGDGEQAPVTSPPQKTPSNDPRPAPTKPPTLNSTRQENQPPLVPRMSAWHSS